MLARFAQTATRAPGGTWSASTDLTDLGNGYPDVSVDRDADALFVAAGSRVVAQADDRAGPRLRNLSVPATTTRTVTVTATDALSHTSTTTASVLVSPAPADPSPPTAAPDPAPAPAPAAGCASRRVITLHPNLPPGNKLRTASLEITGQRRGGSTAGRARSPSTCAASACAR
jgi:hypothetical protein